MEFRLLGPVEAWHGDRRLSLGGPKPRALLAALLLNSGKVISGDRLVDILWGERPPKSAHGLIQTYVYGLRRTLSAVGDEHTIETRPPGYLAHPKPEQVDLEIFERMVANGRSHAEKNDHQSAAEVMRAALQLWRGAALGGIGDALRGEAERLEEIRLTVLEERIDAELALGREMETVGELVELVKGQPAREHLRAQLIVTLYRLGRQADAMTVYHEGRQRLADELGVDPGAELQQLYGAMLRADPSLLRPTMPRPAEAVTLVGPAMPAPGPTPDVAPSQLPRSIADFTGREKQIDELTAILRAQSDAVPVCVISGKGGVGKSALAVKIAHEMADDFPDGQLYADLRGVTDSPTPPQEALGRFLRALGVQPAAIPETLQERVDAYRSLLAGRRLLIVLDDGGMEQQVRPLLPGSRTCAVLITARRRLAGLDGASLVDLDVLAAESAVELLARIAGRERAYAEQDAADRIAVLCGYLPLALRTAGARLVARPHWPLLTLAKRLADERRRLDELAAGDLEVRASVALSYRGLDELATKAFRRLGLLGVPDFAPWVVGALLGVGEATGEEVIERLMDAQLVDFVAVDTAGQLRYRLHDLLRVYAAERAEEEESAEECAAALNRALGGWLWLITHAAAKSPSGAVSLRRHYGMALPIGAEVAERAAADMTAWFNAEASALVVAVERAAAMDLDDVVCETAAALCSSAFSVDARFEDWSRTHEPALAAARRAGNLLGEATLLAGLGQLRCRQDRYAEAKELFHQALPLFKASGDTYGEAVALAGIGTACREQGDFSQALLHLGRAGITFQALHDDAGIGYVNRLAGSVMLDQGDYATAIALLEHALAAFRRLGSKRSQALTMRSIGLVHRASGNLTQAETLCTQAAVLLREAGDPLMEAYAVQALAKTRIRLGGDVSVLPDLVEALITCQRHGDRFGEGLIERTIGELHLARGRYDEAGAHLDRSVAIWDALDMPLFRARVMRDLASVRAASGDATAAEALRTQAIEIFAAFGTREYGELSGWRDSPRD
ncbi:tetratricopeptide repeat protein [Planotetraspora sp. A-T 1434]|uniref:AfsR/SARP family transcriptional regulator n=1 Tax=Planotetraspora sp. A-T 1434 TaxID=2979219 RepID=UPI0021C0A2EC|nr:AfsR/SARP family transcriptional regulator [Planotetraspora sp. A-T 1434]MCT9935390.1 tetratricopeptide repeat protein [Planotetraspora sp. A-T 1434]